MPLERLTFDNGIFKSASENLKNSRTKERESFDRTITDKNNELNDLQSTWDKLIEDLKKYEKQYGTNINADKLSKLTKKAETELKQNSEQLENVKKEIATGLGKRRLMLSEMSGFDLSVVEDSIWITNGNRTAKIDSQDKLENFDIESFFEK